MSEYFRIFIALPVSQPVKDEMRQLQQELRRELPGDTVRWTRPEQIHLTLKFLGNIATEKITKLTESVRAACSGFTPVALRAEGVGFFPAKGPPRVVWVGLRDESAVLKKLQRAVALAVGHFIDAAEEPDYSAHLTLGRARNLRAADGRKLREFGDRFAQKTFGSWKVEVVEIMRSELDAEGSRHTCIATIPLIGGK